MVVLERTDDPIVAKDVPVGTRDFFELEVNRHDLMVRLEVVEAFDEIEAVA